MRPDEQLELQKRSAAWNWKRRPLLLLTGFILIAALGYAALKPRLQSRYRVTSPDGRYVLELFTRKASLIRPRSHVYELVLRDVSTGADAVPPLTGPCEGEDGASLHLRVSWVDKRVRVSGVGLEPIELDTRNPASGWHRAADRPATSTAGS